MRQFILKTSRALFGCPLTPVVCLEKRALIARVASENKLGCFVKTETFQGGMLIAQYKKFQKSFSMKLSQILYDQCRAKFAGDEKVRLFQGDSGIKLGEVAQQISEPALFWLDAHYSRGITAGKGTDAPIIKELSCLTSRKKFRDAVLIDDARLFGLKLGYPKLAVIQKYAALHWPHHNFKVQSDIICIAPAQ